jgi:anti-sigma factor RsiW
MSDKRWCGDSDVLMSYLYEEGDPGERRGFEAHLQDCPDCAREVREFRSVRADLAEWTPPGTVLDFRIVRDEPRRSWLSWFRVPVMPAWAQLGAAAMLVGVAVGLSGLEIRYDDRGVTVRTGWQRADQAGAAVASVPAAQAPASVAADAGANQDAWRTELVALEQRLRRDLQPVPVSGAATRPASTAMPMSDDAFLARVRELIDASESRQNREMAMRIAQVVRDVDTQRRSDFARLTDGMGVIEGRAVSAVAQQRQMIDYLMRVSSQRDPRQ